MGQRSGQRRRSLTLEVLLAAAVGVAAVAPLVVAAGRCSIAVLTSELLGSGQAVAAGGQTSKTSKPLSSDCSLTGLCWF